MVSLIILIYQLTAYLQKRTTILLAIYITVTLARRAITTPSSLQKGISLFTSRKDLKRFNIQAYLYLRGIETKLSILIRILRVQIDPRLSQRLYIKKVLKKIETYTNTLKNNSLYIESYLYKSAVDLQRGNSTSSNLQISYLV